MGVHQQLAKLTAGVKMDNLPGGGIPEFTAADVAAALGYAKGRVPRDRIGAHLVVARYTLDPVSPELLHPMILEEAWALWLKHKRPGLTSVAAMSGLTKLAIHDWCHTEQVRQASESQIARFVGVDRKTWRKRYLTHYGCVMARLYMLSDPVLRIVLQAMTTGVDSIKKTRSGI